MSDIEATFRSWASPPSNSEEDKCNRTIRMIREAISNSPQLSARSISVFLQGSYHNNTNVRLDSDVDVGVLCTDTFYYKLAQNQTEQSLGITPATYDYQTFKNELASALIHKFGNYEISSGNKAFDVKSNTVRVEADVAAFFEHRRYLDNGEYLSGVELRPDNQNSQRIINWPSQHHQNGVNKNNLTGRRYKSIVRILKRIRNEMDAQGISAASPIPGFLIECLVWNVPNSSLSESTYTMSIQESIRFIYNNTLSYDTCSEWGEVSELKYLFRGQQPWTTAQANTFAESAWRYLGFN